MIQAIEPSYEYIGRRIQTVRAQRGLTQQDLADRLRPAVTRASVANLESGKQRVLLHTFLQLCEILECDVHDLLPAHTRPVTVEAENHVASELERLQIPDKTLQRISRKLTAQGVKEVR